MTRCQTAIRLGKNSRSLATLAEPFSCPITYLISFKKIEMAVSAWDYIRLKNEVIQS
jgi:hypothetical protein